MSTNPFSSPPQSASYNPPPALQENSFVKQIPFVGVFMIVQGGLEVLMGFFMLGMLVFMSTVMMNDPRFQEDLQRREQAVVGMRVVTVFYGVGGGASLICGVLRVVGGVFTLQRRARGFAIATNILGFLSMLSCYCSITGIAASIYSLIVLLQTPVAEAFAQAKREREQVMFKP
jgi:hypothetical protein